MNIDDFEIQERAKCILRHADVAEHRDGMANSLGHLRKIIEDAQRILQLTSGEGDARDIPVHLERD